MPSLATSPTLACFACNLRVRALTHVRSVCLPTVSTLAGLPRRSCTCCTCLPLTLLWLSLWLLSLLAALTLLLPSADGCEHFIVRSSTLGHSCDDLLQGGVLVVGRTHELRHICRPGLDCALKSTCLPSEVDERTRLCQNMVAETCLRRLGI